MSKIKEPQFKEKGKYVLTERNVDKPRFKKGNIVVRSSGDKVIVERVLADKAKRTRRVKLRWPDDLVLIVRGPIADSMIEYFNKNCIPNSPDAPEKTA